MSELAELKALVASIAPVNSVLSGHQDSLVQQYVSIRRRFDYAAFAVALYASFEKFVENLATEYIRREAKRVNYAALPEKLTSKHLAGTAELLWRGRLGEGRYVGMSEFGAVKNLFDCLSGASPYTLNEAVVIAHDANLRAGEVDAIFSAIGIENVCDRARKVQALVDWYCTAMTLDDPPHDGVKRTVIDERLKDIVDRRNQVAHRGGNPVNLLGVESMSEAIGFVEALSHSIYALTVGRYLQAHYSASPNRINLVVRQDDGPYRERRVVVVDPPAQRLFVGQPVYAIVEATGAQTGRIQSLQLDGSDIQSVEPNVAGSRGVGVGLSFRFPKSADAELVALTTDDDAVWSPLPVARPPASPT